MNEMEDQPAPINGAVQDSQLSEEQLATRTVNELIALVLRRIQEIKQVKIDLLQATVVVQGKQLQALMSMLVERHDELLEPVLNRDELNRRIRANCQAEIDAIKAMPSIQVAQGVARVVRPGP